MNKQQVIDLWRLSFDDSEEFIRLYFDQVYKDENTLVIEKNGQVVSALQMLPYTMTYYGTEISVSYIYGACTLPEMRGQGLMRQLLQQTFEVMKQREIAITALMPADPWLFDYYREQGFTEAFDYTEETYVRPDIPVQEPFITVVSPEVPTMDTLYAYFNKKLRERPNCIQHTFDDFVIILRDLQQDGGQLLTALSINEEPVGMAFIFPPDKDTSLSDPDTYTFVKEFFYDDDKIANLLLQEATLQHNVKKAVYRTPPAAPGTVPVGMARIIDTHRLIHHWLKTHNNSPFSKKDLEDMDIQTLTRQLLGYPNREAYMSLMLE